MLVAKGRSACRARPRFFSNMVLAPRANPRIERQGWLGWPAGAWLIARGGQVRLRTGDAISDLTSSNSFPASNTS